MFIRRGIVLAGLIFLAGCEKMHPVDFSDSSPRLVLEDYFAGNLCAWGLFEDRFGTVRRQFKVEIEGKWDGSTLILDEAFTYSDGELDRRVWHIEKLGEHRYRGRADDIIGMALGESYGNAVNWRYDMDLNIGSQTLRVHFDDWMFLQPGGVLLNRTKVKKFGIEIGSVSLAFMKACPGGL